MEEGQKFKVSDRRSFLANQPGGETPEKIPSLGSKEKPGSPIEEKASHHETEAYPVDFPSFILSLATSALIHLGEEADPATGKKLVQLPMARQGIDLLALLEEKTQGNLSKDEAALITQLLFTLRMKFVEKEKKAHS